MSKMAIIIEAEDLTKDQADQILTRLKKHLADKPNVRVRGHHTERLVEKAGLPAGQAGQQS